MKITKTYQRYQQHRLLGVIASDQPKLAYLAVEDKRQNKFCISAACEQLLVWKIHSGEKICQISRDYSSEPVTCFSSCNGVDDLTTRVAVGYADGWVFVFNTKTLESEAHFRAGRSRVTCVDFKDEIVVAASESEINLFDMVTSVGSRLKGHRGTITRMRLIFEKKILISSAQDSFIKFWDLKTQHCFLTLTGHPGPVWDFAVNKDGVLVSGSVDSQLRVWRLEYTNQDENEIDGHYPPEADPVDESNLVKPLSEHRFILRAEFLGSVQRTGIRRVHSLCFDPSGIYLLCQSLERNLDVFRFLDTDAKQKRLRKKIKKAKDKGESGPPSKLEIDDELRRICSITLPAKVNSCDILAPQSHICGTINEHHIRFICALNNNTIEELELRVSTSSFKCQVLRPVTKRVAQVPSVRLINRISTLGHRSFPIACSLTSDALGLFTLGRTEVKLWSRESTVCLATLEWKFSGEDQISNVDENFQANNPNMKASSMVLAPGDRHVVVGFESGHLLLFEVNSKSIIQVIEKAHTAAVRAVVLSGDKKGIISGGSDKQVRFYNFDLKMQPNGSPKLCLVESQAAQTVADQVTCLAASPNNRIIAVALMNFHVDVYFADSFKRIHSLYGHAAPVTSLDISSDSRLIITGSGDKTVRLWELQFGNCQKRFTAHMEPITCVRFIPHTLLAVSSDQGGIIKQWDVSKFREVTTLKGHCGSVTSLATAITNAAFMSLKAKEQSKPNIMQQHHQRFDDDQEDDLDELCGGLIVSVGRDFSVRIWSESEDLLVLEEEAELAREAAEEEEDLVRSEAVIPGAIPTEASETATLGRPTSSTRDAADMLMEAIDIYEEESAKQLARNSGKSKDIPPHPLMIARGTICPERFLLKSLMLLRAPSNRIGGGGAGLEHALGSLTTDYARRLLPHLSNWLSRGWEVELVGRAIRHLVTLHFGLVTTSTELRDTLQQSRQARINQCSRVKSLIGMNLAGLEYLSRKMEENQSIVLFEDLLTARDKRIKKQKNKQRRMALLLPG